MPETRFTLITEADQVFIDINGLTDHHADRLTQMQQIERTCWAITVEIPPGFVGTYSFMPVTGELPTFEDTRDRWRYLSALAIPDPAQSGPTLQNAWGGQASVLDLEQQLARYNFTRLPLPSLTWDSTILNNQRPVWWLNTQLVDQSTPVPWVLLLDGNEWVNNLPIAPTLLQLTHEGVLPPARYIFISHLDLSARRQELPNNADFWQAIITELLPALQVTMRSAYSEITVAGQSFGGLAAIFAALHYGGTFRRAISQSGSFWYPDSASAMSSTPDKFTLHQDLTHARQLPPASIFLSVGTLEGNMPVFSNAMADALLQAQVPCQLTHFVGGHDRPSWFLSLLDGLKHTLKER